MYSYNQIFKKTLFFRKPKNTSRRLRDNAQKKGQILKITINTPRKPNSARRKTIKVKYTNKLKPVLYVPGGKHTLKKFLTVLSRGRGPRDTPGVYLSAIRGKFDLHTPLPKKNSKKRRSIYGIKNNFKIEKKVKLKRRKMRELV